MRPLRFVKRAVLAVALLAIVLVAGVSVYLRVEQYRFRRQAEQLLSDVRELELKNESAEQVKVVLRKWGFDEWGRGPGQPCTEDGCIYRLELVPKAAQGHILLDPFNSGFLGRPLAWFGLRLTVVNAWVGIRGKELTSVSFSVWTVGRGCDGHGRPDCTLMGYVDTKQRGTGWSSHQQPDVRLNQSLLHPNYLIGAFPEWRNADTGGNPAVIVWAELSPDANAGSPLRAGQEYVFFLQVHNTPEIGWIALYPCGALSLNDASLAMAREAASNGAD